MTTDFSLGVQREPNSAVGLSSILSTRATLPGPLTPPTLSFAFSLHVRNLPSSYMDLNTYNRLAHFLNLNCIPHNSPLMGQSSLNKLHTLQTMGRLLQGNACNLLQRTSLCETMLYWWGTWGPVKRGEGKHQVLVFWLRILCYFNSVILPECFDLRSSDTKNDMDVLGLISPILGRNESQRLW